MGEDVCSEVRATLRDSIWVSTLGLPFISYDLHDRNDMGVAYGCLVGCSGLLEIGQNEHGMSDILKLGALQTCLDLG